MTIFHHLMMGIAGLVTLAALVVIVRAIGYIRQIRQQL